MKRFRFELQSILKLREDREEEAERRYGRALHQLEIARQRVEQAQAELHLCWQGVNNAATGGCQAWRLEHVRLYAHGLKERLEQLEIQRREAATHVQQALSAWQIARQKREILAKLRDRRHREYAAEGNRAEQKQIDDRVSATFGRSALFATPATQFS